MAEQRETFANLVDDSTGEGVAITRKNEGDAAASADTYGILPVKDSSGNLQYITTDSNGAIAVSTGAPGTPERTQNSQTATINVSVDVVNHTLAADAVYNCIEITGSSTKTTLWQLFQDDNGSDTVLEETHTAPGDYRFSLLLDAGKLEVTAGSTGVQELVLRGTQFLGTGTATDLKGRISTNKKP